MLPGWSCIPAGRRKQSGVCRPAAVLQLLQLYLKPVRKTGIHSSEWETQKVQETKRPVFNYGAGSLAVTDKRQPKNKKSNKQQTNVKLIVQQHLNGSLPFDFLGEFVVEGPSSI